MTKRAPSQEAFKIDADSDTLMEPLIAEMQSLNARMRNDQAKIERLKLETRVISAHTDQL